MGKSGFLIMVIIFIFGLSILPYTISNWLIWQTMKVGTMLPYGAITSKYGRAIGRLIKLIYFGLLIVLSNKYGWICLVTLPFTWFISSWLATIIERKIYMKLAMQNIVRLAQMHKNSDHTIKMINIPEYWFKLMPATWQKDYINILQSLENK